MKSSPSSIKLVLAAVALYASPASSQVVTFTSGEQQQCPVLGCCDFDCCGPGTSWDTTSEYCVVDVSSEGFNGSFPSDFKRDCVERVCCEADCCDVNTFYDDDLRCCVEAAPSAPASPIALAPVEPAFPSAPVAMIESPSMSPSALGDTQSPTSSPAPTVAPTFPAPRPTPVAIECQGIPEGALKRIEITAFRNNSPRRLRGFATIGNPFDWRSKTFRSGPNEVGAKAVAPKNGFSPVPRGKQTIKVGFARRRKGGLTVMYENTLKDEDWHLTDCRGYSVRIFKNLKDNKTTSCFATKFAPPKKQCGNNAVIPKDPFLEWRLAVYSVPK